MKRRNADCGKIRRPVKRNKIAEQIGSNTLLYVKFLLLWALVITADFLVEFRFEFLWPFWLLLRSVHDSFKYKGLAFSVLFVCIAITSDLVCLFFIPVQWLFFAASTYVWVQYVWHTDKGICLPTIILWILFVYLEAAIRWKDSRNIPHLDLCRPFAAHCIGYPVVTLGFGFKSYVGYRIRQRKQREVAKDNDFYMQLLQEALPKEESASGANDDASTSPDQQEQMHHQKDLSVTVTAIQNNHLNNNNNSSNSNKNAQNQNKLLNNLTAHINGHAVGATTSSLNGGINHHQHPKHMHRKSLDKENNTNTNNNNNNSSNSNHHHSNSNLTSNNIKNNYSYHQNSIKETSRSNDLSLNSSTVSSNDVAIATVPVTVSTSTASSSSSTSSSHKDSKETKENHSFSHKKDFEKDTSHSKEKNNFDSVSSSSSSSTSQSAANKSMNEISHETSTKTTSKQNGHIANYDMEIQQQNHHDNENHVEKVIRTGRKNRVKQKDNSATNNTSKDNHNNNHNTHNNYSQHNNHNNHHNNDSNHVLASSVKLCESCARLETEAKRLKGEISSFKHTENDLRQKLESNTTTKSCLLAKQKENEELQNKIQDVINTRQIDRQNLQTVERRLGDERRHRQSLESQLSNERKHRKLSEEKARSECTESCKMKRQQFEMEINKLRRDLISSEDAKHNAEKQSRSFEQEMRKFEVEMRNREPQQSAEVLMSALAAMQDKNATLEKNLSAETRVKLDLFSALGDAKRQLEINNLSLRCKDKEILDLKAKIVQLLAVMPTMPTDSLCLSGPTCSSSGSSMMRLNDAPQLLSQSSISDGNNSGNGVTSQSSPMSHMVMSGSPLISQLNYLGVITSTITTSTAAPTATSSSSSSQLNSGSNGQLVQMQNSSNCPSNLDPNATVYTPKNSMVGGTEA